MKEKILEMAAAYGYGLRCLRLMVGIPLLKNFPFFLPYHGPFLFFFFFFVQFLCIKFMFS